MITEEKFQVYNKYNGDIDAFIRMGSNKEKTLLPDFEWYKLENLIQDFHLIRRELASEAFKEAFLRKLEDDLEDIALLDKFLNGHRLQ